MYVAIKYYGVTRPQCVNFIEICIHGGLVHIKMNHWITLLTDWGCDKMADLSQMIFWNTLALMKTSLWYCNQNDIENLKYVYRYHVACALVSCTPSQYIGLAFVCALFWCWVSLCGPFNNLLIEFYFIMIFIMIFVAIIGIFMAILFILDYTFRLSVTK